MTKEKMKTVAVFQTMTHRAEIEIPERLYKDCMESGFPDALQSYLDEIHFNVADTTLTQLSIWNEDETECCYSYKD